MRPQNIFISISLLLLIALSFLLSARFLFYSDHMFLYDQAREIILTKEMVVNQKPALIGTHSGVGGFFHGPLWLYFLVPFFIFGNGDPYALSFAYILLPIAMVVFGFLVGLKLYDKLFGLLLAFLFAISPRLYSHVPFTHGVFIVPLFYLGLFYFLARYFRGEKYAFVFAVFFVGLTLQFETASSLILIALLPFMYVIGLLIQKKGKHFSFQKIIISQWKVILLSIVSFGISIATFILFDVRHKFLMASSLLSYFQSGEKQKEYIELPGRIWIHLMSFGDFFASNFLHFSTLRLLLIPLLVGAGVYLLLTKKKSKKLLIEYALFLLLPFAMFCIYLLYPYPVYSDYILGLSVPSVLFVTLALYSLKDTLIGKMSLIIVIGLLVAFSVNTVAMHYMNPYVPNGTAGSYRSQKEAVDWVFADAQGKPFGYFVYSPDTFTYGMDYLFWWIGTKQYGVNPESKKLQPTYLILYPANLGDTHASVFWKEHVLHTKGKVIAKKTFESGISVEKIIPAADEPPVAETYHQNLIFR